MPQRGKPASEPACAAGGAVDWRHLNMPEIAVLWNARKDDTAMRVARSRHGGRTAHAIWVGHRGVAGGRPFGHQGEHNVVAMAQKSAEGGGLIAAGTSGNRDQSVIKVRRIK